jgi:hypothetical protein
MITVQLARELRDAGVRWTPASGDRFVVADRDMDDEVFTVSEMTIGVQHVENGEVLAFAGTTERPLDSISLRTALWLPSESQLRELLGASFVALRREDDAWIVEFRLAGTAHAVTDPDPSAAYGRAVLALVRYATASPDAGS